jgi:hypothetical protein
MVAARPFVTALSVAGILLVWPRPAEADIDTPEPTFGDAAAPGTLDDEAPAQPGPAASGELSEDASSEPPASDTASDDPAGTASAATPEPPVTGEGLQVDLDSSAYIARPSYQSVPVERRRLFLPFGLLDRVRLAPFHMSATTEIGTHDSGDSTASLTLHAQMSTGCSCNVGVYATLPASIDLANNARSDDASLGGRASPAVSTGSPAPTNASQSQTQLGTLDVGLFGGTRDTSRSWLYRVGALLPTGSRTPHAWLPSARVGDRVLELPRSAGVRLSMSKLYGLRKLRMCISPLVGFRVDGGIDLASVLALPGNPVHIVPRAGAGMMVSLGGRYTYSVDTALSLDPFAGRGADLRWSAGISARRARVDGSGSVIQPGITIAAVRTAEGWGANLLVDLLATTPVSGDDYD